MSEDKDLMGTTQEEQKTSITCVRHGRVAVLSLLVALCLAPSASATGGESSSGITVVMSSMDNLVTLCTRVWNLLTGNEYFALFLAVGLLSAGFGIFRRAKRAARR